MLLICTHRYEMFHTVAQKSHDIDDMISQTSGLLWVTDRIK